MLEEIHSGNMDVKQYIKLAKDKNSSFRLMGFWHRVYKNYDPRAMILKKLSKKVFSVLKRKDPLLDIALELEEIALNDPYFIERKLYPNVDFYRRAYLPRYWCAEKYVSGLFRYWQVTRLDCALEGSN